MNFHRHDLFREPVLRRPPIDSSERYVTAGVRPPARPVPNPVQQVRPRQLWRTIIVTRNAEAVAAANPDAFVVDHEHRRIWIGGEWCGASSHGKTTNAFRLCAFLCCATTGQLSRVEMFEALWGEKEDGGPDQGAKTLDVLMVQCGPFLRWAGLKRRSNYNGAIEVTLCQRDRALPQRLTFTSGGAVRDCGARS